MFSKLLLKLFILLASFLVFSCGSGGSNTFSEESSLEYETTTTENQNNISQREWLVLIYMNADNDLNYEADDDISEMSRVTYSGKVKLVVLVDFLDKNKTLRIESNDSTGELIFKETNEELDMGSKKTLENFLLENVRLYPAKNIALIFWNHGDGWRTTTKMASFDETNQDYLFMYKITETLAKLENQGIHINLIGFDECLMGMVEVLYDVGQFSDVVVASESLEPGGGWNYTEILQNLVDNPQLSPYDFGEKIVDSYAKLYIDQPNTTLSLFSREEILKLVSELNQLSTKLNYYTYPIFREARENSTTVPGTPQYIDLLSFVNNLSPYFEEAQIIKQLIEEAYIYTNSPKLNGISIYFPSVPSLDQSYICYLKQSPDGLEECFNDPNYYNPFAINLWDDFLKNYYQLGE